MGDMVDCYYCRRNVERDLTVNALLETFGILVTICDDCVTRVDDDANVGMDPEEEEAA
jgi:hypothetical protein